MITPRHLMWALLASAAVCSEPSLGQGTPQLTGTVRDRATNASLEGVRVVVGHFPFFSSVLTVDGEAVTDAAGAFVVSQLTSTTPDNRYHVIVGGGSWIRVAYPDQVCRIQCFLAGTQPSLQLPAAGVNFLTSSAGIVRGRVLRTDTELPPESLRVQVRSASQPSESGDYGMDAQGRFEADGLVPDDYIVSTETSFTTDLVHQVFPGVEFDLTRPLQSLLDSGIVMPAAIQAGQQAVADFNLSPGACLQGSTLSSVDEAPVSAPTRIKRTQPFQAFEFVALNFNSGPIGQFRVDGLMPGATKISFDVGDRFLPAFHPGVSNELDALPVTLVRGQCTQGVVSHLTPRQSVSGAIRDAVTGSGIAGVKVNIGSLVTIFPFPPGLSAVASTTTDSSGAFHLQGISPASSRLVWTDDFGIYFRQGHFQQPPFTPASSWNSIAVPADQQVGAIDFALQKGAFVSGRVSEGGPTAYDNNLYFANVATGALTFAARPGSAEVYATAPFLPTTYRFVLRPGLTNIYYAYPGVPCTGTGPGTGVTLCDVPGAAILNFNEAREYPNMNFNIREIDTLLRNGFE